MLSRGKPLIDYFAAFAHEVGDGACIRFTRSEMAARSAKPRSATMLVAAPAASFCVCGEDGNLIMLYRTFHFAEDAALPPTRLVTRFPRYDRPGFPLNPHYGSFLLPDPGRFHGQPQFNIVRFMDQEGHPSYGIALVYMDASNALSAERPGLEVPPEDVPAGDAWQQRLEMRALALISRRPYFSLFKNILRYIFTVYASSYVVSEVEVSLAIDHHRLVSLRREQQPSESGSLTDREASSDGVAGQYFLPKSQSQRRSRSGTLRRHFSTTDAEEKQAAAVIPYSTPATTRGTNARRHSTLRSFASEEVSSKTDTPGTVRSRHRSNALGGNDSWELDQVDQVVPVTPRGSALELDDGSGAAVWDMAWRRALRVQYRSPQQKTRIRLPLEHFLCAMLEEAPPPQRGQWAEITLPRGIDLRYGHPHIPALPYSEQNNLRILFDSLSIPNILDVMAALLTEHIIFVLSSFSEKLTPCMDALRVLMFPLQCTATNISIVTPSFFSTFADPAVYIFCGVTRDVFNDLKDSCDMSRPVIVDLENDIVRLPETNGHRSPRDSELDRHSSGGGGGGAQQFVPLPAMFRDRADERLRHIDYFRRHGSAALSPEGVLYGGQGSVHSHMAVTDLAEVQAMQQSDSWILEVRLCFLELMLGLLEGFEQFLLVRMPAKASGTGTPRPCAVDRRERTHHFDSKAFIASADLSVQPFLKLLVRTQSFGYFLQTFELVCADPSTLAIRGVEDAHRPQQQRSTEGPPDAGASSAAWAQYLARSTGDDNWWLEAAVATDPSLQDDDAAPGEDSQPALMVTFVRVMRVIRAAIEETLLEGGALQRGEKAANRATKTPPKSFPWPVKMLKRSATSPETVAEADATIRALQARRWLPFSSPAVTTALARTALGYHRRWAEVRPLLASLHGDLPRPIAPPRVPGTSFSAIVASSSETHTSPESWTVQAVFGSRGVSGDPEGWGIHGKYPGLFLDKAILVLDAARSRKGSLVEGEGDVGSASPGPPQWGSIRWIQDHPPLATFPFLDPTLFPKPRRELLCSFRGGGQHDNEAVSPKLARGSVSPMRPLLSKPLPSSRSVATRSSRGSSSASSAPQAVHAEAAGGPPTPADEPQRSKERSSSASSGVVVNKSAKEKLRPGLSIVLGGPLPANNSPPTTTSRVRTPSRQEWAKARRQDVHFFRKHEGKTESPRSRSATASKTRPSPRHMSSPGEGGSIRQEAPNRTNDDEAPNRTNDDDEEEEDRVDDGSGAEVARDHIDGAPAAQEGSPESPLVGNEPSASDLLNFVVYPRMRPSHRRVQSYDIPHALEVGGLLGKEDEDEEEGDAGEQDDKHDSREDNAGGGENVGHGGTLQLWASSQSSRRKPRRSKSVGGKMQWHMVRHAHRLIRRFEATAASAAARARDAEEQVEAYREAFAGSLAHLGSARAACSLIREDWLRVKSELEAMERAHKEAVATAQYQKERAEIAEQQLAAATQSLANVRSQLEDTEEELEALMIDGDTRVGREGARGEGGGSEDGEDGETPYLGGTTMRVKPVDHVGESHPATAVGAAAAQRSSWPQEFRALPLVDPANASARGKHLKERRNESTQETVQELAFHIEELERLLREERDARQRLVDLLGIAEEAVPVLTSSPGLSLAPGQKSLPPEARSVTSWLDFISRRVQRASAVAERRLTDARRNQRARAISRRTRMQQQAGYKERWIHRKWEPRHREQLRQEMIVSLRRELIRQAQLLVDFDGALSRMERSTEEPMEFERDETGVPSVTKTPAGTSRSDVHHREADRPKSAVSGFVPATPNGYSRRWRQQHHNQQQEQQQSSHDRSHSQPPERGKASDEDNAPTDALSHDIDLVRKFLHQRGVQS